MTVRELIEKLQTVPPDFVVKVGPLLPNHDAKYYPANGNVVRDVLTYSPNYPHEEGLAVVSVNPPLTDEQFHNAFLDAA